MPAKDNAPAHTIEGALEAPPHRSIACHLRRTALNLLLASLAVVIVMSLGTATMAATTVDSESSTRALPHKERRA